MCRGTGFVYHVTCGHTRVNLGVRQLQESLITISSRTPEGSFGRCPVCGQGVSIDPSHPPGDAPCPSCGCLIWFSPESETRERHRGRVLALARQIEDLSHPSTDESLFFPEFLQRLLSAINAPAGLVWSTYVSGKAVPLAEHGLSQTSYHTNAHSDQINGSLLMEVYRKGKSQMFGAGEADSLTTPTDHLYVVTPLMAGATCLGFLEVLQRPNTDPRARPGYLQFIEQMGGYAARYMQERGSFA